MAADRPDLISLPETWTNLGGGREAREAAAEILPEPGGTGGVAYEFLRSLAVAHGITVHGGSMIERGPEKLFNTTLVFDRNGAEIARYRKIHLFDITGPDGTGYRESALYGAGDRLVTCQVGDVTLGLTICYDMRFAEQYMALRRMGAEIIFVPSNFTLQTGKDHWEVMLRSRAIESQCWIAAAASWGGPDVVSPQAAASPEMEALGASSSLGGLDVVSPPAAAPPEAEALGAPSSLGGLDVVFPPAAAPPRAAWWQQSQQSDAARRPRARRWFCRQEEG
jgi:predicted amidohydrolase